MPGGEYDSFDEDIRPYQVPHSSVHWHALPAGCPLPLLWCHRQVHVSKQL